MTAPLDAEESAVVVEMADRTAAARDFVLQALRLAKIARDPKRRAYFAERASDVFLGGEVHA